jgi:hypothetical protein
LEKRDCLNFHLDRDSRAKQCECTTSCQRVGPSGGLTFKTNIEISIACMKKYISVLTIALFRSTPILFVMHGVKRDADKYFAKMLKRDLPHKFGFSLICPEFSKVSPPWADFRRDTK